MTPILAFWHRNRRVFVPLTLDEWQRRAPTLTQAERVQLTASGLVAAEIIRDNDRRIYELTPIGQQIARAQMEVKG